MRKRRPDKDAAAAYSKQLEETQELAQAIKDLLIKHEMDVSIAALALTIYTLDDCLTSIDLETVLQEIVSSLKNNREPAF
jgi:NTP pyrophosphatase (non-canonical NTP hydrolase)